jgi:hypothetical protein
MQLSIGASMATQVRGVKIGLIGFGIAAVGAAVGFAGFFLEVRWLSITGLAITAIGVIVGFAGIVYGWLTEGKRAITGSVQSTRELRDKILPNKDSN